MRSGRRTNGGVLAHARKRSKVHSTSPLVTSGETPFRYISPNWVLSNRQCFVAWCGQQLAWTDENLKKKKRISNTTEYDARRKQGRPKGELRSKVLVRNWLLKHLLSLWKTDIRIAVNYNKFLLVPSTSATCFVRSERLRALNTWYLKLKIKCI
jgi:hypothetical protein